MPDEKKQFALINISNVNIDLKSASKAVIKLLDTVSGAVGKWWEPHHTLRMAKAETTAALIQAEADTRLQALAVRAGERLQHQELRRQRNIEAITAGAADVLKETSADAVSDEPVSEDWSAQFFDYCQDVSDQRMQTLWSRLLANEVTKPGSFSPRTLQLVKLLTPADAKLFTQYCSFLLRFGEFKYYSFETEEAEKLIKAARITYERKKHLIAIGLLNPAQSAMNPPDNYLHTVGYFQQKLTIKKIGMPQHPFDILSMDTLTLAGAELVGISGAEPNTEYLHALINSLPKFGVVLQLIT